MITWAAISAIFHNGWSLLRIQHSRICISSTHIFSRSWSFTQNLTANPQFNILPVRTNDHPAGTGNPDVTEMRLWNCPYELDLEIRTRSQFNKNGVSISYLYKQVVSYISNIIHTLQEQMVHTETFLPLRPKIYCVVHTADTRDILIFLRAWTRCTLAIPSLSLSVMCLISLIVAVREELSVLIVPRSTR